MVKNKSNFVPPKNRNQALDEFVKSVENIPLNDKGGEVKDNLTKHERNSIRSLSADKNIIIKEADKGGSIIIMDTEHYKNMVNSILMDESYYERLRSDPQKETRVKYDRLVKKYSNCLTKKEKDYLTCFEKKESQFYGLPKVHKSKQISEKCRTAESSYVKIKDVNDLKLRPIVAGPACQTHRISNLLDILLKPFIKHVPSFLRDTTDFLNNLPKRIPKETILATFDVESLYSNISHSLGIDAINFWIENFPEELPERFSKEFVIDSLRFILENNTFQFNDVFFRQRKGTAMGTKVAPTYATLTIGYLERKLYKQIASDFGPTFREEFENTWKRFLDDCFILWSRSNEDLQKFHTMLNNLHEDINFTIESSKTELPFLDVMIRNIDGLVETDIFYKPTDSKLYLLFQSCHPKHIKTSIPFSLARRLRCIVSNENVLNDRFIELKSFLTRQKYPEKLITAGIEKAKALDLQTVRTVKNKNKQNLITYVSTHNPKHIEIFGDIRNDLQVLTRDEHMKEVLQPYKIIKSKRQPKNLKKLLTRAKFTENQDNPKVSRCNRSKCGLCIHLIEGEEFNFKCGRTIKVVTNITCDVKNVIYVIVCAGCGKEYIGETGDLRKRVTIHNQQIRDITTRMLQVSTHLDNCANTKTPKYHIFPFFKMQTDSVVSRKQRESFYIRTLKPELNAERTGN